MTRPTRWIPAVVALMAIAAVLALSSHPSSAAPRPDAPRLVSLRSCPHLVRVRCGLVAVPADWSTRSGPTLRVRFRVYDHSRVRASALEPIVGMEGGPGFSSIQSAPSYLAMIGWLHRRHDLIVMDDRGTGASGAIDCPALQRYAALARPGRFVAAVDACHRQLAAAASAYSTVAVGDDLAFILKQLHLRSVDVYGDSYGSYSAQVFTLHHPGLVRALVLDGAYNNTYNPLEPEAVAALRRAWTAACRRSPACGTRSILSVIARFTRTLERRPVVGSYRLQPGARPVRVDLTAPAFAQLVYDASYSASIFADLPAALRAYAAGESQPLLRMAAEDREFNASGPANYFSIGDLEAVSCHDYPTAWTRSAAPAVRRAQLSRRIARLGHAFFPFPTRVYLRSYVENELVYGCLNWPPPRTANPPFPRGTRYPHTPTLIFDGEFDFATSLTDATKAARAWPNHTFIEVRNAKHVTAAGDQQNCTAPILRRFLATISTGDTSCAKQMPPIAVLPRFPRRLADAPAAHAATPGQPKRSRRIAWVGAETVADALTAWFAQGAGSGTPADGLFGGSFTAHGNRLSGTAIHITLNRTQLVPGVMVSGTATWQKSRARLIASLALRTPRHALGRLRLIWGTAVANWQRPARITGVINGQALDAQLPAPWVPQS